MRELTNFNLDTLAKGISGLVDHEKKLVFPDRVLCSVAKADRKRIEHVFPHFLNTKLYILYEC